MKLVIYLSLLFAPLLAGGEVAPSEIEEFDEKGVRRLQHRRETIEEWATTRGGFRTLTSLLVDVGLAPDGPLDGPGDFTLFAPYDEAFQNTFAEYPGLDTVLTTPDADGNLTALSTVLQYHVLATRVLAGDIPRSGITAETLNGEELTAFRHCYWWWGWRYCDVLLQDGSPFVAVVTHANFRQSNGVIHAIDKVLIPPSLAETVEGLRVQGGNGH